MNELVALSGLVVATCALRALLATLKMTKSRRRAQQSADGAYFTRRPLNVPRDHILRLHFSLTVRSAKPRNERRRFRLFWQEPDAEIQHVQIRATPITAMLPAMSVPIVRRVRMTPAINGTAARIATKRPSLERRTKSLTKRTNSRPMSAFSPNDNGKSNKEHRRCPCRLGPARRSD